MRLMPQKLGRFLMGLVNLVAVISLALAVQFVLPGGLPATLARMVAAAALVALYLGGARWIERRRPDELRLADSVRGLGAGVAIGVALFSCVMAILWIGGSYRPTGWEIWRPLAVGAALLSAFAGAAFEEIVFRGFLFRLIAGLGGNWTALAITSALFGLAHLGNRGATVASAAAVAIEAGILLGAAYAASGSLWLAIGIHAGWNFAEGPVFGMAVSGHEVKRALIAGELHGPELLTGGVFGPEASIVAVLVCLAMATVYLRRMKGAAPVTAPLASAPAPAE